MATLSVIVPALNEERNLIPTYNEIILAAAQCDGLNLEIIFIDDFSKDQTFATMTNLAKSDPRVKAVRNERNLGLGGTYKKGIPMATGEYYMLVPGDNAWPAAGLAQVMRLIGKADIVIPYIIEAGDKGPFRKFLSRGFTILVNFLFGLKLQYYNGVVIHKTKNLRSIQIEANCFAYQAEALIKLIKLGHTYVELGLNTLPRPDGKSKALRISNLIRVVQTLLSLRLQYLLHGDKFAAKSHAVSTEVSPDSKANKKTG